MNIKIVQSMQRLYEAGKRTREEFVERVKNGSLTTEEFKMITGEDYIPAE